MLARIWSAERPTMMWKYKIQKDNKQCQPQIKPLETHPDAEPKKIVEIFSILGHTSWAR
jgi:hypothetical protein